MYKQRRHDVRSNYDAYFLGVSVLKERIQNVDLRKLCLLVEFQGGRYCRLSAVRNHVVLGFRVWSLESPINAHAHCLLKRNIWAESIDRPLGQDPLIVLKYDLRWQSTPVRQQAY